MVSVTKNKPQVSVVIPVYNAEEILGETLQALETQTLARHLYEIIVVDDGSTDGSIRIAQTFPDVRLLTQDHKGPAIARNLGVDAALGEIVLFTDSDCVAAPDFIAQMLKPFSDPLVVGVKGAYRTRQTTLWARFAQIEFEERYAKLAKSSSIDFVDSHAAAFRIQNFKEVGGFDPHFPVANNEDVDLSYKIARLGYRMVFNPDAIVYHLHPDTMVKYLRTKFSRAYWRMLVYRRFPEKILSDTYTPQTMKLQIILVALMGLDLIIGIKFHSMLTALLYLGVAFIPASAPFLYRVLKKDPKLILFSILALFLRSLVFGLGIVAGVLSQRRRDMLFPTVLVLSDVLAAFGAYLLAFWIRSVLLARFMRPFDHTLSLYLSIFPVVMLFCLIAFLSLGLYRPQHFSTGIEEFAKVTRGVTLMVLSIITLSFFGKWDYSRGFIVLFWVTAIVLFNFNRQAIRSFQRKLQKKGYQLVRTIIVGTGDTGKLLIRSLKDSPGFNMKNIIGVVDDIQPGEQDPDWRSIPYLGKIGDLEKIIRDHSIDDVIIAKPGPTHEQMLDLIVRCEKTGAGFKIVSDLVSIVTGSAGIYYMAGLPMIDLKEEKHDWGRRFIKRIMDISIGSLLIILTAPLFLLISIFVHLTIPGSVLVREERVGKNGRLFKMFRFRTKPSKMEPDMEVVEPMVGKFLQKTFLEELPQLFNVMMGEMSLVGPRPEVPEIVATYDDWQRKRLDVPPGITGLWQVVTPGDRPLHEDLEYDFYYIKNYNIWWDLSLMLRTIPIIIFGRGRMG